MTPLVMRKSWSYDCWSSVNWLGKALCFMDKSTISMAMFNSYVTNNQREYMGYMLDIYIYIYIWIYIYIYTWLYIYMISLVFPDDFPSLSMPVLLSIPLILWVSIPPPWFTMDSRSGSDPWLCQSERSQKESSVFGFFHSTLRYTNIAMENGPFIEDLPMNMVIFYSKLLNFWGYLTRSHDFPI